ncbi:S9 family peptidase [Pigmentiphaga sp. H8]|uniref:alpha/beta hydrolase family protein n=1 Tax=Pigmentiphaga sp. H8 TaxID=2488560 RepID=UPI00137593CD|nr:alpha/beta hydrolase [Pigmentiphaga sp. H8]
MLPKRIHELILAGAAALTLLAAGATSAQAAPPALRPGQLLTAKPHTLGRIPGAGRTLLISYVSTSFTNQPTVAYGQVTLPDAPPPPGGYPVVSWAHGTTGFAPQCSPSLMGPGSATGLLAELVRRGYAVLRTDYEGWGANGERPLLHGPSNANAVVDIVAAAHGLGEKLADDWLVAGHSEGGGAALWVASREPRPPYRLRGALAFAPTGPGVMTFMDGAADGGFVHVAAQPFVSLTVLAAHAVDPSISLDQLVRPDFRPQVDAARQACLGALREQPQLRPGQYLSRGREYDKVAVFVNAQDPSRLAMRVPVLVMQGEKDETSVTPPTTRAMIASLCQNAKAPVAYREYAGATHGTVLPAAMDDALAFAQAAREGRAEGQACR